MADDQQLDPDSVAAAMSWADGKTEEQLDFDAKRNHGGSAFWVFAIVSPFLFWLVRPRPSGWIVPTYCLGGAFVIPIASILTFFIKMRLASHITPRQAISLQIPWFLFDTAFSILTTWLLFALLARI